VYANRGLPDSGVAGICSLYRGDAMIFSYENYRRFLA
jgi:hypothetical protein